MFARTDDVYQWLILPSRIIGKYSLLCDTMRHCIGEYKFEGPWSSTFTYKKGARFYASNMIFCLIPRNLPHSFYYTGVLNVTMDECFTYGTNYTSIVPYRSRLLRSISENIFKRARVCTKHEKWGRGRKYDSNEDNNFLIMYQYSTVVTRRIRHRSRYSLPRLY